jgi:hypothetical protein
MSSDIQETADNLNHAVADRETEADEIGYGALISRIEPKTKAKTLRSKAGARCRSISGILETLLAVLLVSLLFFFQSVASFFSRK